jgi:hypothetical protein
MMWGTREWLTREAPVLFGIFTDFGLEVHVKKAGQTALPKSVVLFFPKPARCYTDKVAFDGADLSDIDIGNGEPVTAVQEAKYLGSYATQAGTDLRDVEERISKASQAFGALKYCLFRQRDIATEVKRSVYCGLILAILLFGAEHGCLTAKMVRMLRAFHHRCMRSMCRLNRLWHTRHNHIKTKKTSTPATRPGIQTIETYIARRQLRWLGHVWRMPETRLPKKLLTAWLPQKRPVGRPELTCGQTVVRTRHVQLKRLEGWFNQQRQQQRQQQPLQLQSQLRQQAQQQQHYEQATGATEPRRTRQLSVTACFALAQRQQQQQKSGGSSSSSSKRSTALPTQEPTASSTRQCAVQLQEKT